MYGDGGLACAEGAGGSVTRQNGQVIVVLAGDDHKGPVGANGEIARPLAATRVDADAVQRAVALNGVGGDGVVGAGAHVEMLVVGADVDVGHGEAIVGVGNGRVVGHMRQITIVVGKHRHRAGQFIGHIQELAVGVKDGMAWAIARRYADRVDALEVGVIGIDGVDNELIGAEICRDDVLPIGGNGRRMGMWALLAGMIGSGASMLLEVVETSNITHGADAEQTDVATAVVTHHHEVFVGVDGDMTRPITTTRATSAVAEGALVVADGDYAARHAGAHVGLADGVDHVSVADHK